MAFVPNGCKVLLLRFFGQTNRAPEIQVVIRFLEVLAPCSEKPRVRRYHDAVQPGREKYYEREANISCKKGLKNPERLRVECIAEQAECRNKTSCGVGVSFPIHPSKAPYSYCRGMSAAKRQQDCT